MKRLFTYFPLLLALLLLQGIYNIGQAQITQSQVIVQGDTTNFTSRYEITFDISNGKGNALNPSENDSIIVIFNNETTLPTTISPTEITVNGTNAANNSDVVITNQRLAIRTPVQVTGVGQNSPTVNIVISKSAEIRNPSTAGTFTLDAATTEEPTLVTSAGYDIFQSTTTVSSASVTPSPSIENRSASYAIGFSVGEGGFLATGETVTLEFPTGTTVPGGSIAGVTFNGTSTSAIGDATNNTVNISVASTVKNQGSVSIELGKGSGLQNPPAGTNYQLNVNTSVETTPVASQTYNISNPEDLSFSAVTLANDTANAVSRYDIDFFVGTPGGALSAGLGDKIIFTFFSPTKLPSSISGSNITVLNKENGFSNNPSVVRLDEFTSAGSIDSVQVVIETPIDIGDGDQVRVTFSKNAGIQNTAVPGSDSLRAKTTEADESITINTSTISNPFAVVAPTTSITQPSVSVSNAAEGQLSSYSIDFNVGDFGRLVGGFSTVEITFPTGTDLSTISNLNVNSTAASFNTSGTDLTITIPQSIEIANNGSISLQINDITNPPEGTYSLETNTSVETSIVQSQSYDISNSQINVTNTDIGTNTVNSVSSFGFDFQGASKLTTNAQGNDFVELTFPEGTILPTTIGVGDVDLTGQSVSAVDVDSTNRVLKIFVGDNNKTPTRVDVFNSAGIRHPAVPQTGFYEVLVATSEDAPGRSPAYDLVGNNTAVTADTVISNPSTFSASSPSYEVLFTTGPNGKLEGGTAAGSSTITVRFNDPTQSTNVPGTMSSNDVTLNGNTVGNITINGDDITIEVPNGVELPGGEQVTLNFSSSAGLSNNAASAGDFTVQVQTSSETAFSQETNNLTLTSAITLNVNSLSKTETRVNTASGYTIKFTPGTNAGLTTDTDTIFVDFPNNTFVPTPFSSSFVAINGVQPNFAPEVTGNDQLAIVTPVDLNAETEATLSLSANSGILNPSFVSSSFTADLFTNLEPTPVASPSYATTATSTTVSKASVNLQDASPGAVTTYNIDFNTGPAGRLIEGTSTVSIRFPSGTSFGTLSATINGTTVNTISVNSNVVTFTLPDLPSDSVWNSDDIALEVNGVTNPSTTGDFTLEAKTSVETSFVQSETYNISNVGPVTINTFQITRDTVNQPGDYFFEFTVDGASGALAADSGTITIKFPGSSEIPSSIGTASITTGNSSTGVSANASAISTSPINNTVEITTSVDIANGDVASVTFFETAGVRNPKEPNSYSWEIKTSSQPTNQNTALTAIQPSFNTGISDLSVTVEPDVTGEPVEWTWGFDTGNLGAVDPGVGSFFLEFGDGNAIFNQDPIPASSITVNGIQLENDAVSPPNSTLFTSLDTTVYQIRVPSSVSISRNDTVTIIFTKAAGVEVDPSLAKTTGKTKGNSGPPVIQAQQNFETSSSPEPTSTANSDNPLPIELVEFFVSENANEDPVLKWATATEKENFGFFIERKFDSESELETDNVNWKEIDFVEGQGTTKQRTDYSYTDNELTEAGVYKYRLRQVDFDGTKERFGPVTFTFNVPEKSELHQNFPNPFNPTTNINYQLSQTGEVTVKVYNVLGREVRTLVNQEQQAGRYTVTFDASSLASGLYIVRMNTNGRVMTRKIMLVK